MKCWICGQEGNTGEHMIKASDLRSYFGNISQKNPIFFHTKEKKNIPVGSLKSKRFKFDSLICNNCNSSLTQPYDQAWEQLSAYLRSNWPDLLKSRKVNLTKIFPGSVHRSMLFVHLYFLKIFGCKIVESGAPIDTVSFSDRGRWFQNNLTKHNKRDSIATCPDNQDLIHLVPCIILWDVELMEKRYSAIRRIVRIFVTG